MDLTITRSAVRPIVRRAVRRSARTSARSIGRARSDARTGSVRTPSRLEDFAARGVILAGGVLVLVLMLWGHFGVGAFFFPPARTAAQQVAVAGPYRVALTITSGQLTARGPNTVAFVLEDRAGHTLPGAKLLVEPWMTTMPMAARPLVATSRAGGRVVIHPIFGMAGTWRLILTVTPLGQPPTHLSFDVGVRWS